MKLNLTIFVIFLILFSCNSVTKEILHFDDFPYNLNVPDQGYKLNSELEEISALSYLEDGLLACIQDEDGILYIVDPHKGEIVSKHNFRKDGDYEGLEVIGNTAYVLRSDGTLYEILNFSQNDPEVKSHDTPLHARNNTEGLAYDAAQHSLLIACKDQAFINESTDHHRAVYQFKLENKSFVQQPYFVIEEDNLAELVNKKVDFHPSGIAIHPLTQEVYIISTNSKMLVVLNNEGDIVAIKYLPRNVFKQPEGICFAPDGTLYISNEGRGGKGNILRFQYKKDVKH